ncbi:hypothetical protein MRBLMI12_000470 [Microbacterium sp. LMI12-1-1.1]|uniref:hypothetical protein n=1 Tax=Microbacterium sp. LMI12-1-1.1 TaxID=3135225 RepID=UPI0034448501
MILATDPNPPAYPTWEDMTPAERDEHRQWCHDFCGICEAHRAFGECDSCGAETEAVGPDELSRCCGSPVKLSSPFEDNLLALRAA